MVLESFRFSAFIFEALLDPSPLVLLHALGLTFAIEVASRLAWPAWWCAMATRSEETHVVARIIRRFLMPTSLTVYLNDLKNVVGFARFPAVLALWAGRSVAVGHLEMGDDMRIILMTAAFVFIEESLEDIAVASMGHIFRKRLPCFLVPDWSNDPHFIELGEKHQRYHPAQIVGNPSLKYELLPLMATACVASRAVTAQLSTIIIVVGLQWTIGCATHMNHYDNTLVWWPFDLSCRP